MLKKKREESIRILINSKALRKYEERYLIYLVLYLTKVSQDNDQVLNDIYNTLEENLTDNNYNPGNAIEGIIQIAGSNNIRL